MYEQRSRPTNPALTRAISTALPSVPHIQSPAPQGATKSHTAPELRRPDPPPPPPSTVPNYRTNPARCAKSP
jgi:hypothetical protein